MLATDILLDAPCSPSTVPTPALVVDASIVRRNIQRLAAYAWKVGLTIRPHTKTHKSRELARMQLACGANGLTVAKAGEAEVMATVCDDLLLAYPVVDGWRAKRLAELARDAIVRVAIDSALAVDALADAARRAGTTIAVLIDVDVGMGRTGVQTPQESLVLAQRVQTANGLALAGLMCYPGHIWDPPGQQDRPLGEVGRRLEQTLDLWTRNGLEAGIVSGGSTPTAYQSHLISRLTEIRPGTYVYNDMNIVRGGYCAIDDCAARVVCTVISNAVKGQIVLDAGSKTLSTDLCVPAPESGHGYVVELPSARIVKLSEEHAQVDVSGCDRVPQVGERVTVIPNHICPCVNLRDHLWWCEEGEELTNLAVDARGKVV